MHARTFSILFLTLASLFLTATGANAASASHGGSIGVTVTAEGQPAKGLKVCASAKKAPATSAVEGSCGKTGANGYALLTNVPPGHWFVTLYNGTTPAQSASGKAAVRAGIVTKFAFHEQVG
ncbi:MAG TPA: hypothetical protein VH063_04665 [Gaiellaceae bacterium]|nr:hypothetical protein [Gaiellaceae bacterium]